MDYKRAEELLKAESEGRLVVLPCRVGETLYRVRGHQTTSYKSAYAYVQPVTFSHNNFFKIVFGDEMGKTVFLTREEAEAVVREWNHD